MKSFGYALTLMLLPLCQSATAFWSKKVSMIGVGDIMMGTNHPQGYLPPNDGAQLMAPVESLLRSADVTFGNLEGTVLDHGGTPKTCANPELCYLFRMPVKNLRPLVRSGFDFLSLANNHVGDFGDYGRAKTIENLEQLGFAYAGLLEFPTAIIRRKGLNFGLAAFAPNHGTVDIRNISQAAEIVRKLAAKVDIVIVSFHGGAEGSGHQRVTRKTEFFHGENRGNVYAFAHAMIDAGADVIFGHGPHVTRAVELYQDRFIAYSLGNFCTYARFNLRGPNGIAPIIKVYTRKNGQFIRAEVTSIRQEGEGGVQLDPEHTAFHTIKSLTESDFPDSNLEFTQKHQIVPKS
jgi:poly-gamma-glutamate capsule biosynthesis protein CapA/YwtB (metallophosphatase superfamily)